MPVTVGTARFKAGDVVTLKSGERRMTVQGEFDSMDRRIVCHWTADDGTLQEGKFLPECLMLAS